MPVRADRRSPEAAKYRDWYKTKEWHRIRTKHLAAEPDCRVCLRQQRFDPSFVPDREQRKVVDHVKPHRGDWSLFIDPTNLQTLCATHHSSTKQTMEKRQHVVAIGLDGWPEET